MFQAFHLTILFLMIEPTRTNRNIYLRRIPEKFRCISEYIPTSQILRLAKYPQLFVVFLRTGIDSRSKHGSTPFRLAADSFLVAYPAHIVTHNSHYSFRL